MIAITSRMLLVRIAGVPACFAALAIRYITDFSSTYSGSPSTAWQEMIICPRILFNSSCLSIILLLLSYFMKHSVSDDFIISWRKIFSIYYVDRKFYF